MQFNLSLGAVTIVVFVSILHYTYTTTASSCRPLTIAGVWRHIMRELVLGVTLFLPPVTPDFPRKTKCLTICMPGSSFIHIVTS
jgi:hypothetical protein